MKLKDGFILHQVGGQSMMVATGERCRDFNGLVRSNETAEFILRQLMQDTTEDRIVEAMTREYQAPEEVIRKDVRRLLEQLDQEGFLDA